MLPYSAYFDTLASIGNADSAEWQATAAGLVVLRLVNDWLDFGPNVVASHGSYAMVRQVIAQIPDPKRVKPILKQVTTAVERAKLAELHAVTQPLFNYTHALYEDGQYELVVDALLPLLHHAQRTRDTAAAVPLALKLGLASRTIGDVDLAENYYGTAMHYARKNGDTVGALYAACGELKIVASRGDWSRAETMSADILTAAEIAGNPQLLSAALHDRAYLSALNNDNATAIPLLQRALYYATDREPILADLASTQILSGRLSRGRNTSVALAITATNQVIRWQAIATLMCAAITEHDHATFELYRTALQLAPLDPWLAVGYRKHAAHGLRSFGDEVGAQRVIQEGYAIAARYQIHSRYVE